MEYIEKICEECEKQFIVKNIKINQKKRFCSGHCAKSNTGKRNTGRKFPVEINKKKGRKGKLNGFYGKKHTKKQKELWRNRLLNKTYEELYGKEKAIRMKEKLSLFNIGEKNRFYGKKHTIKTKNRMSVVKSQMIANGNLFIKNSRNSYKGFYISSKNKISFYYDSAFERFRMEQLDLDDNIVKWTKKHGIKIPYRINKQIKNFVPDFLIEYKNGRKVLEETKGYDSKEKYKKSSMQRYCKNNNLEFSWIKKLNGYNKWLEKFKKYNGGL